MASSFMTEPLASTATPRPVEAKPQVTVAPHETKPTTDDVVTARPPLQLDYFDPTAFQFLPQAARVLDLIIKGGDRSEIARQAANLYQHLDDCEKIVQQLPGAEWSTHQQEVWLDRARTDLRRKTLTREVGFANLPNQVHRRSVKRGFEFVVMVVGESGMGKSTMVNTLFNSQLIPVKEDLPPSVESTKTVAIQNISAEIQENGVKLRLSVVDTPGFGDFINNEESWKPILVDIESRFDSYLAQETRANRTQFVDNRVHACIYFIAPTGHSLRAIDIEFMKRLHTKVNLIPVIAKSDTLTEDEVTAFKVRVLADIAQHNIQIFRPLSDAFDDPETVAENRDIMTKIPFAIIGSNRDVTTPDGRTVRGRKYPWGVIEVDNEEHNDFVKLRQMLIRTHMEELKDHTSHVLYENYRTAKLLSLGKVQDNAVFREYNPVHQMEEERRLHEIKMQKMESEMNAVFQQKVQEKEQKLKQSEEELYARHKEMKVTLEKQRLDLEEKRRRLESNIRPSTADRKVKKGFGFK
ncbi:Cell division control protein 3 [Tieghemiomyces parasiticus]|uniref:Cell division control protein 3 n=1 Tax=Tieghemiomyces parasiticus TaxID=78921 RepID=A0A9W8AAY5_9FUNG|nr:Cell division control protein 3 [Tieghemiomyces parasiticus]